MLLASVLEYSEEQIKSLLMSMNDLSRNLLPRQFIQHEVVPLEEDNQVEFKRDLSKNEEVVITRVGNHFLRYTNAFLNALGGVLYVGVADDSVIRGVSLSDKGIDSLRSIVCSHLDASFPPIPHHFVHIQPYPLVQQTVGKTLNHLRGQMVLVLYVLAHRVPGPGCYIVSSKGVAWERVGASTNRIPERCYPEVSRLDLNSSNVTLSLHAALRGHQLRSIKPRKVSEDLPIMKYEGQFKHLINHHRAIIVTGGTGTGKSSHLPTLIVDSYPSNHVNVRVLVAQPRRLAAVALANYVAHQRGVVLGSEVGYHIGGRKVACDATRIVYCTVGVLLNLTRNDTINSFSHIVLDEVHERSMEVDLSLVLLRERLVKNTDLRVFLCSATANVDKLSKYYGGFNVDVTDDDEIIPSSFSVDTRVAPIINIEGRRFNVEVSYLEDILNLTGTTIDVVDFIISKPRFHSELLVEIVGNLIGYLLPTLERNISVSSLLIFLPGIASIHEWIAYISALYPLRFEFCIAHSTVSIEEQEILFSPAANGKIKIIMATDIAESSLTIPDVFVVIDTCIKKSLFYNSNSGHSFLRETWISQDSAIQREGRSGRVAPGKCFRLIPKSFFLEMDVYSQTEIQTSCLDDVILKVSGVSSSPIDILQQCMDPPSLTSIDSVLQNLVDCGALRPLATSSTRAFTRTALGQFLSVIPLSWNLSMLLVRGVCLGMLDYAIILASILVRSSPVISSREIGPQVFESLLSLSGGYRSDHTAAINGYTKWTQHFEQFSSIEEEKEFLQEHYLSGFWLREIDDYVYQLKSILSFFRLTKQPSKLDAVRRMKSLWIQQDVVNQVLTELSQSHKSKGRLLTFDSDDDDDLIDEGDLDSNTVVNFEPFQDSMVPCFDEETVSDGVKNSSVHTYLNPNLLSMKEHKNFIQFSTHKDVFRGIFLILGATFCQSLFCLKPEADRAIFNFRNVTPKSKTDVNYVILKEVDSSIDSDSLTAVINEQLVLPSFTVTKLDSPLSNDFLVIFLPKGCFSQVVEAFARIPPPTLKCQAIQLPPFSGSPTKPSLCFYPAENVAIPNTSIVFGYGLAFDSLTSFNGGLVGVSTNCTSTIKSGTVSHFSRFNTLFPANWHYPHLILHCLFGSDVVLTPSVDSSSNKTYILSSRFRGTAFQRTYYFRHEIVLKLQSLRKQFRYFTELVMEDLFTTSQSTLTKLNRTECQQIQASFKRDLIELLENNQIESPPTLYASKFKTLPVLREDEIIQMRKSLGLTFLDDETSQDEESGSESD
ncbi:hypothetical protein GEMRC1_007806 [Eukaryota sp. GEM-RC1]